MIRGLFVTMNGRAINLLLPLRCGQRDLPLTQLLNQARLSQELRRVLSMHTLLPINCGL